MKTSLVKSGLTLASPGGRRWLSILIYHRVLQQPDPLLPGLIDVRGFDDQIATMARSFNLPLQEAIERLAEGKLPPRAAAITFDDGYADNCETALPILKKYGVHATFFIAAGYLDGGYMWNDGIIEAVRRCSCNEIVLDELELPDLPITSEADRKRAIVRLVTRLKYLPAGFRDDWTRQLLARVGVEPPTQLMMTSEQVLQLARAGMGIGGHHGCSPDFDQGESRSGARAYCGRTNKIADNHRQADQSLRLSEWATGYRFWSAARRTRARTGIRCSAFNPLGHSSNGR